jgi:LysM repeat protein
MIVPSTPNAEGKIIHEVQSYQALIPIAAAYGVTVDTILQMNGLQIDWPLQIGQKLVISPGNFTPTPTPPPLTPVEVLTPASDGKYYHTVQSGETLSWIATLYSITLYDLMAWNGMNSSSILHPGDKLLLQVTPPATLTPTPGPPTLAPTATRTSIPPTATLTPSLTPLSPTATPPPDPPLGGNPMGWAGLVVLAIGGGAVILWVTRKKTVPSKENAEKP